MQAHGVARAGAPSRLAARPLRRAFRRASPCVCAASNPAPPPAPPPSSQQQPVVAGIDLGTCNSAIAIISPTGRPTIVPDRETGAPTTPSWVAVDPSTLAWLVGERARAAASTNPANTFPTPKRLLGRKFRGFDAATLGGGAALVEAFDGGAEWWCPARGEALPPDAVAGVLLAHLLARAGGPLERGGAGRPVSAAVITVPARHSPAQLAATEAAAKAAGLTAVRLIPEPVAAAVAYGIGGGAAAAAAAAAITDVLPHPDPTTDATVLVVDVGGGTTDVAVVDAFEGMLEVLAAGGDARLGGGDWDAALADWLAAQHPVAALLAGAAAAAAGDDTGVKAAAVGVARMIGRTAAAAAASVKAGAKKEADGGSSASVAPPFPSPPPPQILHGGGAAALGLRAAAESAKVALSSSDSTDVELRLVPGGPAARVALSRARFEDLTAPLVERVVALVEATAKEAGVQLAGVAQPPNPPSTRQAPADLKYAPPPRTITHAILVGGGSRVPALRSAIARLVGQEPRDGIDPEACVALGAAAVAAALAGDPEGGAGFELADGPYTPSHGRASGFGSAPTAAV